MRQIRKYQTTDRPNQIYSLVGKIFEIGAESLAEISVQVILF
jgi:hypothetical protein